MPGFNISIGSYHFDEKLKHANRINASVKGENYSIQQFSLNKFNEDKLCYQDENYAIVLDGVILNKSTIHAAAQAWPETIIQLYLNKGDAFYSCFRGSFCGALYDKTKDKWIIFTDHIGSKQLFYHTDKDNFQLSSDITDIYQLFKKEKINYSLDINSAYMLLSFGYMIEDVTLCDSIKKLLPGSYILIQNGKVETQQYYTIPTSTIAKDCSINDLIEEVDQKFKNAVQLQFEKDKSYGYKHLVGLSGGLDSRMTSWVAHEMGYTNQLNFTFSESDYLDEKIPKRIASDLRHEWIFKALDNGNFLRDVDEINLISGGNTQYFGLSHGNSFYKYLNFDSLGILHSGQLGDVIIGSYIKSLSASRIENGANSQKLITNCTFSPYSKDPIEREKQMLTRRGFNGINSGLLAVQQHTETVSPFYDIDFFEACLNIPLNFRIGHKLYHQWMLKKYPEASQYIWESTGKKINQKTIYIRYKGKKLALEKIPQYIKIKLNNGRSASYTKNHMNPIDYWLRTNPEIASFLDDYFNQHLDLIQDKELKENCIQLYNTGNSREKCQVISLLSALKLYF